MDFIALLNGFLTPDNTIRKAAEAQLQQLKVHKDALPLELTKVLRTSPELRLRLLATVLLRRVCTEFTDEEQETTRWELISAENRAHIQRELLLAIEEEPADTIRRKVCDTLAQIAVVIFCCNEAWPELWAKMHAWVTTTGNAATPAIWAKQEAALVLFEYLGEHIAEDESLKASFPAFSAIFKDKLCDVTAPLRVRAAACSASISVMISLEPKSSSMDHFNPLVPHLLSVFLTALQAKDDDKCMTLISILIDLVDIHPTSFKKCIPETVKLMSEAADGGGGAITALPKGGVDNEVRRLCLEFLTTLAEKVPALLRKLMPGKEFLKTLIPVVLRMLLEHGEDEPTDQIWDATEGGNDLYEDGEGCNIPNAEESLDRIGASMKAEEFLPAYIPAVKQLFAVADEQHHKGVHTGPSAAWKYRVAGLSALAEASSLYSDENDQHQSIIAIALPCVLDTGRYVSPGSPNGVVPGTIRVRHAALGLIGNLCHYQAPMFQLHTHEQIVPAMLAGLQDPISKRVRAQASLCVAGFAQQLSADVDEDCLKPHLGALFPALFALLGGSDRWTQQQAITAVSALAEASQALVEPYYSVIVNGVKAILAWDDVKIDPSLMAMLKSGSASGASSSSSGGQRKLLHEQLANARHVRMMKGRALECLTVMGSCVGADKFKADAEQAMAGIAGMIRQQQAVKAALAGASAEEAYYGSSSGVAGGEDDPVPRFMWEAVGRIAKTIGGDAFSPYLSVVLPPLLDELKKKANVTVVQRKQANEDGDGIGDDDEDDDEEEEEEEEDEDFTTMEQTGKNGAKVTVKVRTAALDDKQSAMQAISNILQHCEGTSGLGPFLPDLVAAILPMLRPGSDAPLDDIRAAAAGGVPYLLTSAVSAITVGEAIGAYNSALTTCPQTAEGLQQLFASASALAGSTGNPTLAVLKVVYDCIQSLATALEEEADDGNNSQEMLVAFVTALVESLQEACDTGNFTDGTALLTAASSTTTSNAASAASPVPKALPLLNAFMLHRLTTVLLKVRRDCVQRRAVRAGEIRVHSEDYDEAAIEDLKKQDEEDAQLSFFAIEALGTLIKTHTTHYLPIFKACGLDQMIKDVSHDECLGADRQLGVFLIDDLLEYCGENAIDATVSPPRPYSLDFLPILIRAGANCNHDATRQGALYGLGAAAENLPVSYAPHIAAAALTLTNAIAKPLHKKRSEVEDNAVTALGKLIIHQYSPETGFPLRHAEALAGAAALPLAALPSRQDLINSFLLGLPCRVDRDEARVGIQMLCSFLDGRDPCVLPLSIAAATGEELSLHAARLGHILKVFADTLKDKITCTPSVRSRMVASMAKLRAELPPALLGQVWGALSDEDKGRIAELAAAK